MFCNICSDQTFYAVFLLKVSTVINVESDGTELIFNTGLTQSTNLLENASIEINDWFSYSFFLPSQYELDQTTYVRYSSNLSALTPTVVWDFGVLKQLTHFDIAIASTDITGAHSNSAVMQYSTNGTDWTTFHTFTTGTSGWSQGVQTNVNFTAQYIRLSVTIQASERRYYDVYYINAN